MTCARALSEAQSPYAAPLSEDNVPPVGRKRLIRQEGTGTDGEGSGAEGGEW